jgi:hypothetical protein
VAPHVLFLTHGRPLTVLGLKKLKTILTHRTDFTDGNLLRAQTAAASTAIHAQLKADETRLRQKTQGDVLERLLRAIEVEKARQAKQAEKKDMDLVHIDNKPNGTEGL